MAKFCSKCGTKLDETTGLCPNCDKKKRKKKDDIGTDPNQTLTKKELKKRKKKEKKQGKKLRKKEKRMKMTKGQRVRSAILKFVLFLILFIVVAGGVLGALTYFDIVDVPIVNEILILAGFEENVENEDDRESMMKKYEVPTKDAESYYQNNSEIISEINANDSKDVCTEAEAFKYFSERGFTQYSITTQYSMEGIYSDTVDISDTSSEKHPSYQTYYTTQNGDIWTIFIINGNIMANPVSYNIQSELGVQVIISESDTVTSYDSADNKFYETIPKESALIVITVEKINSDALEELTIGEINNNV